MQCNTNLHYDEWEVGIAEFTTLDTQYCVQCLSNKTL